uniref:Tetratricopeptide repeat domain 9B n=1 Tax=Fundulus heteroclitus TaxID=8078 RepID=A0A3Q2P8U2_FUNHE
MKFREAIGKYHRALLQLKAVHVVDGTTGSEVSLLSQATAKLTEEQRRAVESTEIDCSDSLTGDKKMNARLLSLLPENVEDYHDLCTSAGLIPHSHFLSDCQSPVHELLTGSLVLH